MCIFVIDTSSVKNSSRLVSDIANYSKDCHLECSFVLCSYLNDIKKDILSKLNNKSNSIVVIGDNSFLNKIINIVNDIGRISDTAFGFYSNSSDIYSKIFGTNTSLRECVSIMSQRLNREVDAFFINDKLFYSFIEFVFPFGFSSEIDSSFIFKTQENCKVIISGLYFDFISNNISNYNDDLFDIIVISNKTKKVVSRFKAFSFNMNSKNKNIRYIINGAIYKSNNIQIKSSKSKIKFIISKNSLLSICE